MAGTAPAIVRSEQRERVVKATFFSVVGGALCLAVLSFFLAVQWIGRPFPGFLVYDNLAVSPFYLEGWSGREAGLRFLDRVVRVNERTVSTASELDSAIVGAPREPARMQVQRAKERKQVSLPVAEFTMRDWILIYGFYLVISVVFLGMGLWPVLARARGSPVFLFFSMCLSIFVWFVSAFDFSTTHFLPPLVYVFGNVFTASLGGHLAVVLFSGAAERKGWPVFVLYVPSLLLGFLYLQTFRTNPSLWEMGVRGVYAYLLGCALLFLAMALRGYVRSAGLEKQRALVVLGGSVLGFLLPSMGTVAASVLGWRIPFNVLVLGSVFFPFSVAYALVKYNLFQIDGLIRKGVESCLFALVFAILYVLIFFVIRALAPGESASTTTVLLFLALSGLVTRPALSVVQRAINASLYQRREGLRSLLKAAEKELRSTLDDSFLIEKVLAILCEHGKMGGAAIVLRSPDHDYEVRGVRGIDVLRVGQKFSGDEPLFRLMELTRSMVAREELQGSLLLNERAGEMMRRMDALSAHLVAPLVWSEKMQGFIAVGQHTAFRVEDYELVESVATLASACLENAALFRGLQASERRYKDLLSEAEAVKRHLEEANRLKEEWIANVSHEIRTPLNSIRGFIQLLTDARVDSLNEEARAMVDRIAENAQVLDRLLTDLTDFSRARKGQARVKKERVHVGNLLEALRPFLSRLVANSSIELRWKLSPDSWVETDRGVLRGILVALLENAAKFTEKGLIEVEARSLPSQMEVRISDTGIGIKDEDHGKIFEEFRQLDGSSSRERGGTGLGLAMCKKYSELLGASLSVQSKVNTGSTFTLLLPR